MKNKKKLVVLLLQIVLIVVFIFTYKQYVEFSLQPTEVFGYARTLDSGIKITERDLVPISLSQMTLTNDMVLVTDKASVIGKYTTLKVIGNSIVYRGQLGDITSVDKFAALDLSNSRVIGLPVSYETLFAGDLERGDTIDLMYTATASVTNGEEGSSFSYAKIFMQNVPIYRISTSSGFPYIAHADEQQYVAAEDGSVTSSTYDAPAILSLIVSPEQAEEIEARRMTGSLVYIKRFEESETHETLGFVIGEYGKLFAGNANAETGNIKISDAYLTGGDVFGDEESDGNNFGSGNMEVE